METSIFTPDIERLGKLKIQEATEVFGRLLWCEAARLGLVNIVVSGDVNSADGGIDAKAELVGGKGGHSFHYQIKTGTSFKPWQPAAITKELFGDARARPSRSGLGPAVRRCMNNGGTYVMLALGHDLLAENHSLAVELISESFKKCGYKNPRVQVWGSRQVANMLERYPSLCLDLGAMGDLRFQTVSSWAMNGDMTPKLSLGEMQEQFITRLQTLLTGPDVQHARVVGEPGIGKTRLVLEAIQKLRTLAAKAIYVPSAELFQTSRLFFELLKEDREYSAVLVVDECDDDERASIFRALKGRTRIKLVTIDHGPETSADSLMEVLKFPPLEDAQIEAILRQYIGKSVHARNWVSWCEGSARVAHAVGDNLKRNPGDILKSPAVVPIWERFVLGYSKARGEAADRLMTIVRHIALFRKFGARRPVAAEADYIAQLAGRIDPAITKSAFDLAVDKLAERRILQGSHTLRLVPRALHVHLWKQWWQIHGSRVDLAALMDEMPETLRKWFLDMMIYSNGVPSAQAAIKEVLSAKDGPFTSMEFVATNSGSRFLTVMAEADPAATLAVLQRTVGAASRAEVRRFGDGRQNLIHALEKIAVWSQHFAPAVRLLAHLCFGESTTYSNNAKGTLIGLFVLRGGATQANPLDRLAFAQELVNDADDFNRRLGLELLKAFLTDKSRTRIIGVEYQGLAPEIEFWEPKLWSDLFDPRKMALRGLLASSKPKDPEWQAALSEVIIEGADDLLRSKEASDWAISVLREHLNFPGGNREVLTRMLINRVKRPYSGTPPNVTEALSAILDATETGSFSSRFDRFVTYDIHEENYSVSSSGEYIESDVPTKRVEALAREFVGSPAIRRESLETVMRSPGPRASSFGRFVAQMSSEVVNLDDEIFTCAEILQDDVGNFFLSGYLEEIKGSDRVRWEVHALRLLADEKPATWKIRAVVFSGLSPKVTERLLDLFATGSVHAFYFQNIGWNFGETDLTSDQVQSICSRLEKSGDPEAARAAVQIVSSRFARKQTDCSAELLWSLLMNPKVFERHDDHMTSYYWKTLATAFRTRHPERDLELLAGILTVHCNSYSTHSYGGVFETVAEISEARPKDCWPLVGQALETSEASWTIAHWLGENYRRENSPKGATRPLLPIDAFDPEQILCWLSEKPSRSELIMEAIPRSLEPGAGGELARGFIDFFGARSKEARSLMGYFESGTRWGPDSAYYAKRRDSARIWIEAASPAVREWIGEWIDYLSNRIEQARIAEEREF
ncbi:hypothetical protein ACSFBF_27360 [Variovorax sp. ZT5P49]|uniref:hypothetical protein n=1 Tax=Variovorax sp. ZT5P49 TaxID=3443733 RepID=UPI003F450AB6